MGNNKEEKVINEEVKSESTIKGKTRLEVLIDEKTESRKKINEAVEAANESEDLDEVKACLKVIDEQVPIHNAKCGEIYLETKLTSGKSALEIMHDYVKDQTYKIVRVSQDRENGSYVVSEASVFMNAETVHAGAKGGIGNDKNWVSYSHKLNYLVAVRLCKKVISDEETRKKIAESYEMKDAVRAVLFPDKIDPLKDVDNKKGIISNRNILAALKYVIASMIGEEYKTAVTSFHANYLLDAYASHDKKSIGGGLKAPNDKQFTRLLVDVCYLIMNKQECKISGGNFKK